MSVIYNIRSTSKEPKTTGTAKLSKSGGGSGILGKPKKKLKVLQKVMWSEVI